MFQVMETKAIDVTVGRVQSQCKALGKVAKANCKARLPLGKLVNGRALVKNEMYAILDFGFERNAIMLNNGLWGFRHLSVGDWIKSYVEENDENEEYVIVSRRQLDETERWELMKRLCVTGGEVKANVVQLTRRGIGMEVCGLMGAIFWTKGLIELENEIRNKSAIMVRVRATCERYNMIVLTPARAIEDTIRRKTNVVVWTTVLGLCDLGLWTYVDACNGVITLSGKPWCCALNVINQLTLGKLVISNFVKIENALRPLQTGDCVDLIVNFMLEVDKSLKWDRNVFSIEIACVWKWVITLTTGTRERWCDWKETRRNARKLNHRGFNGPSEGIVSNETKEEIDGTIAKQNAIWNEEQLTLNEMESGFEFERFKLTKLVLSKVRKGQLCTEDESWLRKVEKAWMFESGELVLLKTKWHTISVGDKWKYVLARLKTEGRGFKWKEELDYANIRRLKDEELLDELIEIQAKADKTKRNEEKDGKVERNNLKEKRWALANVRNEDLPRVVETELDEKWEMEWQLNREPSYRRKCDSETDCALVETSYEVWRGVRALRPVYAVIVGIDVQVTMLMVAITKTVLAYVCDLSIANEDVTMLANDWGNDLALKVAPIGLNFGIDDVMVEIDVQWYKSLRFVNANLEKSLIGIVAKVGETDVIIALTNEIYGTLRFEIATGNFGIEVGMEAKVKVVEWNPSTNDINLEISEEEEANTLLVETTKFEGGEVCFEKQT
ncbi:MAG: hypothetical protein ACEY26_00680 [Candidatus Hodgkinia cicadicola]